MKIIIALLLISFSAFGSNWMPDSFITEKSSQAYQLEGVCQLSHQPKCFDVGDEPDMVKEGFVSVIDEQITKSDVESCESEEDCQDKHENKVCSDSEETSIKNINLMEVYCSKVIPKHIVKDLSGWSAFKAGKATQQAMINAKAKVKTLRECLAAVIDTLVLRNASKGLTESQVEQMVTTYQPIMDLLYAASGATAKTKILAVTPDGVLVTSGDKTAPVADIDKCLLAAQ